MLNQLWTSIRQAPTLVSFWLNEGTKVLRPISYAQRGEVNMFKVPGVMNLIQHIQHVIQHLWPNTVHDE